ncbi:uncharacterized protein LOC143483182 isoform X5 [Brachyhypopomus gauderio]|uniref:uncharacterized protein LOC143483182 isoform X5 n=1 Tax=Brachyhypopomus gauderio TaxID=698409 RepID=UPI0040429DA9
MLAGTGALLEMYRFLFTSQSLMHSQIWSQCRRVEVSQFDSFIFGLLCPECNIFSIENRVTTTVTRTPDISSSKDSIVTFSSTARTSRNTTENKEQTQENKERKTIIWSLMGVGLLLLTVLVCSICMSKRKCKVSRSAGSAQADTHTAAATSDDTMLYSSIGFKSKKSKQRSLEKQPLDAHDDIIYSSVANR